MLDISYKWYYTKSIMKRFVFDRTVDRENICNLKQERKKLFQLIQQNANVVIYAPRNYGKTSILKNVIIPAFKKKHKRSFVYFADLFQVKDLDTLIQRMASAFEVSFEKSFPIKNLLDNVKSYFRSLQPAITIDPHTGNTNISIMPILKNKSYSIDSILNLISDISKKVPSLFIIDEFQDIVFVPEAEASFRSAFQTIETLPIILSGSKRHILTKIFANPDSPLAFWGVDLEFKPIPYKKFHYYIKERFELHGITIDLRHSTLIQQMMQRIPEPINILCQQIIDMFPGQNLKEYKIYKALYQLLENRESRYETYIGLLSTSEEKILINLAKIGSVKQVQSKDFVSHTGYTARTVGKVIERLMNRGIVEKYNNGYRITDPLLRYYLLRYR